MFPFLLPADHVLRFTSFDATFLRDEVAWGEGGAFGSGNFKPVFKPNCYLSLAMKVPMQFSYLLNFGIFKDSQLFIEQSSDMTSLSLFGLFIPS